MYTLQLQEQHTLQYFQTEEKSLQQAGHGSQMQSTQSSDPPPTDKRSISVGTGQPHQLLRVRKLHSEHTRPYESSSTPSATSTVVAQSHLPSPSGAISLVRHKIMKRKTVPSNARTQPRSHHCKISNTPRIGGGPEDCTIQTTVSRKIIYAQNVKLKGPAWVADISSATCMQSTQWRPNHHLNFQRSQHPLDLLITPFHTELIIKTCQLPADIAILYSDDKPEATVTSRQLRNLITHGTPISDAILFLFLEIFCEFFDFSSLPSKFLDFLRRDGWANTTRLFAQDRRNKQRNKFRPNMKGEKAIAIPCFINDCHWIGVVRRETKFISCIQMT
jgi:hypothetical protein